MRQFTRLRLKIEPITHYATISNYAITPKKMANYAITPEKLANYAFTQPYNPPPLQDNLVVSTEQR